MQVKPSPQILSQKISDIIRQKITIGELSPGEKLSETALSDSLAISRDTLREVFHLLTQEGLLTRTIHNFYMHLILKKMNK
ncbi:GntR family transcriptional regulator [Proteus myxofaciens ATCC 19692]|uniref:GntR family transcriptional regulator n=1 Tax=Proteus myxofaciens ATCC 19692 TaxID=1354337 RepID=A0A198FPP0_9GAMM|nr:GntR family transcriptional regulator [Proteus myxofaciens ATCC 19692]